uniref:RING-type domain-containing protein n=1 Tax=Brassica oleracea var. oleracea TaxID=109376 RepID=A0A0D3AP26_BRAOL
MPKSDLVEEVRRLQAALSEQTDISKQEYEKLQDEKILCKVCIVEPIDVVLLPCKHHALCRMDRRWRPRIEAVSGFGPVRSSKEGMGRGMKPSADSRQ